MDDVVDEVLIDKLRKLYLPKDFDRFSAHNLLSNKDFVLELLQPSYMEHILSTPLVDVFSISMVDDGNEMSCEIYGTIQVIDGEGGSFILYDRDEYHPETISPKGGSLTLTFPQTGRAITPSNVVKLEFNLKDRARGGVDVVKQTCFWDYSTKNDYDRIIKEKIVGVGGAVIVEYVTYSNAVFATVDVRLAGDVAQGGCQTANVYGNITAYFGGDKYTTILFDRGETEAVQVEYGALIPISKSVLVLPLHSSPRLVVNLWNHDTGNLFAQGDDEICLTFFGSTGDIFRQQSAPFNIGVRVQFGYSNAYIQEATAEASTGKNSMLHIEKKPRLFPPRILVSDSLKLFEQRGSFLVEVFSISVFSSSDEEFNIWGSITFSSRDSDYSFGLFDNDKSSSIRLLSGQIVPIECPSKYFATQSFTIRVKLYDSHELLMSNGGIQWAYDSKGGLMNCNGGIKWEDRQLKDPIPWFNRKLSSVVGGYPGYYAAVNYSIFPAGSQVTLKFYLKDESSSLKFSQVHGSVCGEYGSYTYLTLYEKDYFRKKLFARDPKDSALGYTDSIIMLAESVMAVPVGSNFIVDVKLKVETLNHMVQSFDERMIFNNDAELTIEGTLLQLVVNVVWSEVAVYS